jgi:hypothetical protein
MTMRPRPRCPERKFLDDASPLDDASVTDIPTLDIVQARDNHKSYS